MSLGQGNVLYDICTCSPNCFENKTIRSIKKCQLEPDKIIYKVFALSSVTELRALSLVQIARDMLFPML